MVYRPLGATQIEVSGAGFGAASLGGVYRQMTAAQARLTVPRAMDAESISSMSSPTTGKP